jgi:hypothetical protein
MSTVGTSISGVVQLGILQLSGKPTSRADASTCPRVSRAATLTTAMCLTSVRILKLSDFLKTRRRLYLYITIIYNYNVKL